MDSVVTFSLTFALPTMRLSSRLSALVIATLVASTACTSNESSAAATKTVGDTNQASPTTAGGTLATGAVPRDSISDRADRGRILGDSTASTWVIMVSDFQCPFCKQWHDAQFAGVQEYATKNRVRLAFLNFPLSMHANAMPASEAAMCASVQGKFWPMHEGLFATQKRWESMANATALYDSLATAAGVNMATYKQCIAKHLTVPLIEADRERGRQAGVASTPTFFVGSQALQGADANIKAAIDSALAKAPAKKPD
jgi:protein-disulfide isomerase